jgi:hypothetical protein
MAIWNPALVPVVAADCEYQVYPGGSVGSAVLLGAGDEPALGDVPALVPVWLVSDLPRLREPADELMRWATAKPPRTPIATIAAAAQTKSVVRLLRLEA